MATQTITRTMQSLPNLPTATVSEKRAAPSKPVQAQPQSQQNANPSLENEAISAQVVDDLLTHWAAQPEQPPLIAYPRGDDPKDFEHFTPKQLDDFTDAAVKCLIKEGLNPVTGDETKVVAMLGQSGLDYMINMFALTRLGYTVFLLSPRLAMEAYTALLETTKCTTICYASSQQDTASKIQADISSTSFISMIPRSAFDVLIQSPRFTLPTDKASQSGKVAFILHSSGSMGLPKPVYQTHRACLANWTYGQGYPALLTVPLFHMFGYTNLFRAITKRCILHFFNANPQATSQLIAAIYTAKPIVLQAVPYTLQVLSETPEGMAALKTLKFVSSAGSAVPDELGNKLVSNGVLVISSWGSTECGALMMSLIGKDWAYLRFMPFAAPHVWMKPLGDGTYELVALESLPSRNVSNSDDPPNSFHTRDFFIPHPTEKDAWKYMGRLDDRVTLVNGEKVLPLPIEGRLRQDPLIREAVVFGVGRPLPGALLFRSEAARDLDDEAFISAVWPTIELANAGAEKFSQLSRATVVPMGADVTYPHTDKGTFIRPQVYKVFGREIDGMYNRLDSTTEGTLRLSRGELEDYILTNCRDKLGIDLPDAATDFFSAGVDSIVAINMASFLKKNLYLGGQGASFGATTVFEAGNAARLAQRIAQMQNGEMAEGTQEEELKAMEKLIEQYSSFSTPPASPTSSSAPPSPRSSSFGALTSLLSKFSPFSKPEETHSLSTTSTPRAILLTGATGFLGGHILSSLLTHTSTPRIYCLIRASSPSAATSRLHASLAAQGISLHPSAQSRITALSCDLPSPDLGLPKHALAELRDTVGTIIHCAWAVNFALSVRSFEPHIAGLANLLHLALSTPSMRPRPAVFFLSSISAATRSGQLVPEAVPESLTAAEQMGYGRSKLVAERIVQNCVKQTGLDARVLRVGQVCASRETGVWNDAEAVPLMMRAVAHTGALPSTAKGRLTVNWVPVDYVADVISDIVSGTTTISSDEKSEEANPAAKGAASKEAEVYNIVNTHTFDWTSQLLPALSTAGLSFEMVPAEEWIARLMREADPEVNPAVKLVGFYQGMLGLLGPEVGGGEKGEVEFEMRKVMQVSERMKEGPDVLGDGTLRKMVGRWMEGGEVKA